MPQTARPRQRRQREQRGAALVESAIVIIPLCLILFGIVEFGFIFKDSLTLSSATRAGARTASAATNETNFMSAAKDATAQAAAAASFSNNDEMFIYKARADGLPESGNGKVCSVNCERYTYTPSGWTRSGGTGWPPASQQACLGGTIDSVGVSLRLTHKSITGFFAFLDNKQLTERTVMRLEPVENGC